MESSWILSVSIKLGLLPHFEAWRGKAISTSHVGIQPCDPEVRLKEEPSLALPWCLFQNPEHMFWKAPPVHPQCGEEPSTSSASHVDTLSLPGQSKHPCLSPPLVFMLRRASVLHFTSRPEDHMQAWVMAGQAWGARGPFNRQLGPVHTPHPPCPLPLDNCTAEEHFWRKRIGQPIFMA